MPLSPLLLLVAAAHVRAQASIPFAATFPQHLRTVVCGRPALGSTVESVVEGALHTLFKGAPNINLAFDPPACQPLFPDQQATVLIRVLATAPGCVQASGNVAVTVRNVGEAIGHEELLWFCNKPENLRTAGPLFDGLLTPDSPVRLLYHHQNRGTQPLYMRIEIVNDSDNAARVWIIPGDGRPNRDPVWSGLRAARTFLPALLVGSGQALDLPPHTSQPIGFRRLVMGDTASGLATLKLDAGGPRTVEVRAEAIIPVRLSRDWTEALMDPCPWHWVKPHGVFSRVPSDYTITPLVYLHPFIEASLSVEVGGKPASAKFGIEGIPRQGGGRGLNGNYAVLHTYDVTLKNPTGRRAHVDLWVDATTNYTAAVFAMPSRTIWLRPLQKHESRKVVSIPLDAGERRDFKIRTIPISGGWYPATIRLVPVAGN